MPHSSIGVIHYGVCDVVTLDRGHYVCRVFLIVKLSTVYPNLLAHNRLIFIRSPQNFLQINEPPTKIREQNANGKIWGDRKNFSQKIMGGGGKKPLLEAYTYIILIAYLIRRKSLGSTKCEEFLN